MVLAIIDAILAGIQLIVAAVGASAVRDFYWLYFDHSEVIECSLLHPSDLYFSSIVGVHETTENYAKCGYVSPNCGAAWRGCRFGLMKSEYLSRSQDPSGRDLHHRCNYTVSQKNVPP